MAFQQPTQRLTFPQHNSHQSTNSHAANQQSYQPAITESQEWILFAPGSQTESSVRQTETARTAGLSDLSAHPGSSFLEDDVTEDAELDSLDDGLHAFREPAAYSGGASAEGPMLPAHDGLGSFQASSAPVLEQLWQHEQYNAKRKHNNHIRRPSSVQRHLDTIDEYEAQAHEEKRMRIEKWRMEQSQALLEQVSRETKHRSRETSLHSSHEEDIFGTTPKQKDFVARPKPEQPADTETQPENEPFWRRITRKFIRDIIGIDDPLLSVILGESLPGEETPRAASPAPQLDGGNTTPHETDSSWRDKLLQRIAHELGVFPSQLTPHPGAFSSYSPANLDYAGMPVSNLKKSLTITSTVSKPQPSFALSLGPNFPPTLRDDLHAESWGYEEESATSILNSSLDLKREREYWEKELDVKMVFRYLRDRFTAPGAEAQPQPLHKDNSAHRAAIIRQHHPLVNRRSPTQLRRDTRLSTRRASSSCASESLKGSRKASALRSGSSRNYWDLGGSIGSGSVIANSYV